MGTSWTIDNLLQESYEISSRSDLEKILDRLAGKRCDPMVVYRLVKGKGDELYFGVGGPETRLDHSPVNGPYYASIGDSGRQGEVIYSSGGEITEEPLRNHLPWAVAREAILEFYDTGGKLPSRILWEEI